MSDNELPRILLVDDETNLLEGVVRGLHHAFSIVTASGGQAGIEILRREPRFAVAVSDLRMPGMDGIAFLRHAREIAPESVRMLFTGQADLADAIQAVNEGAIFRFITKPCPLPTFKNILDTGLKQWQLVTAERVLLEQTLRGSVKTLTDVLALVSPLAFGRATRARQCIAEIAQRCAVSDQWPVEVAAMLSQVGCVTLPPDLLEKLYHGQTLDEAEQAMIDRLPDITEQLLGNIPRLEPVRRILRYQNMRYDGGGSSRDRVRGEDLPWGARALKIVLDLDVLEAQGTSGDAAFSILHSREGWYDPIILKAVAEAHGSSTDRGQTKEVALREVQPGMVFAEDVMTTRGLLLIARGQEVTPSLLERIWNFSSRLKIKEPVRVLASKPPLVSGETTHFESDSRDDFLGVNAIT